MCCVCAGTAKIADVGLARIMQHTLSNTATGDPAGTFAYAAPEMLMGEKWDDKVNNLPPPPHLGAPPIGPDACNSFNSGCVITCVASAVTLRLSVHYMACRVPSAVCQATCAASYLFGVAFHIHLCKVIE